MYTASQKRKENIAEYLLYMWQIEDLIRANNLDIDKIRSSIIDLYDLPPEKKKEMEEWYESLIDMMRREGVEKNGHLQLNKNVIIQLDDLHRQLMAPCVLIFAGGQSRQALSVYGLRLLCFMRAVLTDLLMMYGKCLLLKS